MRVFASISPWLPLLSDFLSSLVVLEEKAAELYHLSLLEKPVSSQRTQETIFGIEKGGKAFQKLHWHLMQQGFQRRSKKTNSDSKIPISYFREDLGDVHFTCPQTRPNQKPPSQGLAVTPDKRIILLLENPHFVDVSYLGKSYSVLIPQVGRFILDKGLQLSTGRYLNQNKIYESARNLLITLDLLVSNEELQEEALNDFLEIRPPALLKEFLHRLKLNGPGSVLWDSAQKLYLERYPASKIVSLTKWYWNFLPTLSRFLENQKDLMS